MEDKKVLDAMEFQAACVERFAEAIKSGGFGYEEVATEVYEPIAEKFTSTILNDESYRSLFGEDVVQYLFIMNSFCFEAGFVIGGLEAPELVSDEYIAELVEGEVVGLFEVAAREKAGIADDDDATQRLYNPVFRAWAEMNDPYWNVEDNLEYKYSGFIASFLVGAGMAKGAGGNAGGMYS